MIAFNLLTIGLLAAALLGIASIAAAFFSNWE